MLPCPLDGPEKGVNILLDKEVETFLHADNAPEADQFIKRTYREGWSLV